MNRVNSHEAPLALFPSAVAIEALQAVGTGKKGSHACSPELAAAFAAEIRGGRVSGPTQAAFFAAMFLKRPAPEEAPLVDCLPAGALDSTTALAKVFAPDVSQEILGHCVSALEGHEFSYDAALSVGRFLFSSDANQGDSARALLASVLRMRHTEAPEYAGLLEAMNETVRPQFRGARPAGSRVIQLADPFDGMERADSTTPVLAHALVAAGAKVVTMAGPSDFSNPGPKFGLTPGELAAALDMPRVRTLEDVSKSGPFGGVACQDDLSPAVARWVTLRRHTVKRPFLATLEKYLSPWAADVFVSSAFHANFNNKMIETAEMAGFPAAVVTFKGIEGSLTLSLARATSIMATRRTSSGQYDRKLFEFRGEAFGFPVIPDPKGEAPPTAESSARKIRKFVETGMSGDSGFDARAQYSVKVYGEVLKWVGERD